ncbi:MAG: hypothetical protein LBC25_00755, partial [Holosporales bacterium]|nr:hypothetical protein [Holosporales bacterium]
MRTVFGAYSPSVALNILLRREWASIVGESLYGSSEIVEARFVGKERIDVYCRILGAACIEARNRESAIVERVRELTDTPNVRVFF